MQNLYAVKGYYTVFWQIIQHRTALNCHILSGPAFDAKYLVKGVHAQ